jgi:hypothetical protein
MRLYFILIAIFFLPVSQLTAQRGCSTVAYQQNELRNDPSFATEVNRIETFIRQQISYKVSASPAARLQQMIITIPVVVHILYYQPGENISDQKVFDQIEMLNQCFRRLNADTNNTPSVFKSVAADCEIEFKLAISDPQKRSTTGIIRKYAPVTEWKADDQMKFSAQMGDDAWDSKMYFNIWVCNMKGVAGYASAPGGDAGKDGIVIGYKVFGKNNVSGFEMGRTAVHETGHWLGLRHLWGDINCGDDLVDDTPRQGNYNIGCPSGIRVTCNNEPTGDMYMNYMDYTNDACINIFTEGQKTRMRTLFEEEGPRYSILLSSGLQNPLFNESPLPEESPRWLQPRLYPNPATNELILDIAYDARWIGKTISIVNASGQLVMQVPISSKIQNINISHLKSGVYFLSVKKEDGSFIKQKFVKI